MSAVHPAGGADADRVDLRIGQQLVRSWCRPSAARSARAKAWARSGTSSQQATSCAPWTCSLRLLAMPHGEITPHPTIP